MDATTVCALMLKARQIFGGANTFLSFPLNPPPFTRRELDFFDQSSGDAARASISHHRNFSTLVNMIPTGEAWQPTAAEMLWDAYEAILEDANFAFSSRTEEEEAAYQAARALLQVDGADTPLMLAYKQCRDAWHLGRQHYETVKSTAENGDEAEKKRWREIDEPRLLAEQQALLNAWIVEGQKNEVEATQARIASLAARSPLLTRNDWKARFNEDIDTLNDPSDPREVFPSGFSPLNAVDDGAWSNFTLSAPEIAALINEMPPALRKARIGNAVPSPTQSIEMEFSSAVVVRSWFEPDAFSAQFWRFPDKTRLMSDGQDPPAGECPAYVSGVVFARHVNVIDTKPIPPKGFPSFPMATVGQVKVTPVVRPRVRTRPRVTGRPRIRDHRREAVPRPSMVLAQSVKRMPVRHAIVSGTLVKPMTPVIGVFQPTPVTPSPKAVDDKIYILAFLCKRVGLCPNPDERLQW